MTYEENLYTNDIENIYSKNIFLTRDYIDILEKLSDLAFKHDDKLRSEIESNTKSAKEILIKILKEKIREDIMYYGIEDIFMEQFEDDIDYIFRFKRKLSLEYEEKKYFNKEEFKICMGKFINLISKFKENENKLEFFSKLKKFNKYYEEIIRIKKLLSRELELEDFLEIKNVDKSYEELVHLTNKINEFLNKKNITLYKSRYSVEKNQYDDEKKSRIIDELERLKKCDDKIICINNLNRESEVFLEIENVNINKNDKEIVESKNQINKLLKKEYDIEYEPRYLLGKNEYDDEIIKLRDNESAYDEYKIYMQEINSKIEDLSILILSEALTNTKETLEYEVIVKKAIELSKITVKEIEKEINYDEIMTTNLLNSLIMNIFAKVFEIYNYRTSNADYNYYLHDYKNNILQLNILEKTIKDKIINRINNEIEIKFPKFKINNMESNILFYSNSMLMAIMSRIIWYFKVNKIQPFKYKNDEYIIYTDLGDKGKKIQIKELHKKILIYMCHLLYKEKTLFIEFNYNEFNNLIKKLSDEENKESSNKEKKKQIIINCIKELGHISFDKIDKCGKTMTYKLIDIIEFADDYVQIKMGEWSWWNNENILVAIDKESFKYTEKGGLYPVGCEFSLVLELSNYICINKDMLKMDKDGYLERDINDTLLLKILAYNKDNTDKYDKLLNLKEKIVENQNSKWEIEFSINEEKYDSRKSKTKIFEKIRFKNSDLLVKTDGNN